MEVGRRRLPLPVRSIIWRGHDLASLVLLEVDLELLPHIFDLVLNEHAQNRGQLLELAVVQAAEPAEDVDAIVGLQLEVFRDVVHYYSLRKVPAQAAQILHVDALSELAAVPVEPVADALELVEVVEDPVRVLFQPGRENDQLVVLGHLSQESGCMRPGPVVAPSRVEVH